MAKKPYRKCPTCGKLVSMQMDTCDCGAYVGSQVPVMMEPEEAEQEALRSQSWESRKKGTGHEAPRSQSWEREAEQKTLQTEEEKEKETGEKYVQRCPNCGTDFFFESPNMRLESCTRCGNRRIRFVEPIPVKKEKPEQAEEHCLQLEKIGRFAGYQKEICWKGEPIVVGREAECSEYLSRDGRVSAAHCSFTYRDGAWYVQDENSTNSTLLNERAVSSQKPERLHRGDFIVLGNQIDSMEFQVVMLK